MPSSFLTAAWRDLVLLNWRVDPALLQPHVPVGTELDPWEVDPWVSLVGFRFSIPLFVRNNFDRELAAAIAEDSAAENTLQNSIRIAEARLAAALESYNLFAGAWLEWEQTGVGSIGRQAEVLEVLYAAGEISASEFLVQTRQTVVARSTAMELRLDLWRSWLEVLAASGLANRWLSLSEDPL